MDRTIKRSALFCVLIFGLCEAHWKIEDDWPRNPLPVSKDNIDAKAKKNVLLIENTTGESIQRVMEEYPTKVAKAEKEFKDVWKKLAETQQGFQNIEDNVMSIGDEDYRFDRETGSTELKEDSQDYTSILHADQIASELEATLRYLENEKRKSIQNIEYRKQQELSDSERGLNRRSRVEVEMPNVSFGFNVPNAQTLIYLQNKDEKQLASASMKFSVETNPLTLFPFRTSPQGNVAINSSDGTRTQGELFPGAILQLYNYDGELKKSPYQIHIENNCTVKTIIDMSPDGTIQRLYQTTDELRDGVFTQRTEKWENHPETKWSKQELHTQSVDLNDPQEEVVLNGLCQSSLNIIGYEGDRMVSKKRLVCKNDYLS